MEPLTQSNVQPLDVKLPFASGQLWSGWYTCAQGETELVFRVTETHGTSVKAVFEFDHSQSGAYGSYDVDGKFDTRSSRITFTPGAWIEHPPSYTAVGMTGLVKNNTFSGKIDQDSCGEFTLSLRTDFEDED